ncbi:MAG: hypothetical protein Sapg2KO_40730 [Saprospiraceae bacterium]
MKQLSLIFVFVACFSFTGKAQIDLDYWGLKFGLSLPSVQDNSGSELGLTTRVTYHFGAFKSFQINSFLSFKTELMYSEKGGRKRPPNIFIGIINPYEVRTRYVTLPLIAQASYDRLYMEVGIEPGVQVNVKVINDNAGFDTDMIAESWTNSFDLNAVFGIGVYDDISGFEANIRYLPSITKASNEINVVDDNGQVIGTERFGRNQVYQVSVSYRFGGQ